MSVYDHTYDVSGIDMTVQGNTLLGTTPGNAVYYPLDLQLICTDASGALSEVTINLGTNSPNYDNIISGLVLVGLTSANKLLRVDQIATLIDRVPINTAIYLRVALQSLLGTGKLWAILNGTYLPYP